MSAAKHTPTPWEAVRENEYVTNIEAEDGRAIACTSGGWDDTPEQHAEIDPNARFIVQAVNAHDALVEALAPWAEDPTSCLASSTGAVAPREGCDCVMCVRTRMAQAALAIAEPQS